MKLTLLILLFPMMCVAQQYNSPQQYSPSMKLDSQRWTPKDTVIIIKRQPVHHWASTALCAVSVISGALGDGYNSRAIYTPGHALCAVSYASLLAIPFTGRVDWKMPVTYVLLRFALFDLLYNVGAHRKLNYMGGKNYWDESAGRMPFGALSALKVISFGTVIYLNSKK